MKIELSDEVLIAMGMTPESNPWGSYQFPRPFRTDDSIVVAFHVDRDDMAHYGSENLWYESKDNGNTWKKVSSDISAQCGLKLQNGDRIYFPPVSGFSVADYVMPNQVYRTPGVDMKKAAQEGTLPFPDGMTGWMDGTVIYAYNADRLPPSLRRKQWLMHRLHEGDTVPNVETASLEWPCFTRVVFCGKSYDRIMKGVYPQGTVKIGPDGAIWVTTFSGEGHINPTNGQYSPYYSAEILRSVDMGHTFSQYAHMEYPADGNEYPYLSGGFSDNDIAFFPGGVMAWVFRSNWYGSTGEEWSPMYLALSHDLGKTWCPPKRFTPIGTKPRFCPLKCGVTLLCYARPGIFIRYTKDGIDWSDPVELMTPDDRSGLMNVPVSTPTFHQWDGACNNPDMIALDDHSALIFYSDFYYPDQQGVRRKSILCRKITVKE